MVVDLLIVTALGAAAILGALLFAGVLVDATEPAPPFELHVPPRWEGQSLVFDWAPTPLRLEPHALVLPNGRRTPLSQVHQLCALNGRVFLVLSEGALPIGRTGLPDLDADRHLEPLNRAIRERAVPASPADRAAAHQALAALRRAGHKES